MNIGHLVATLGVNIRELEKATAGMKKFEKTATSSIDKVNQKLESAGNAMKKFGRNMSMYVTAPMALVGTGALNMYKQFESSMTKIVGLVGVARGTVDEWSDAILRMAPALGKAPAELADAMFFVTSAGIRGKEALEVLEMSAKASAAGLGETKVVADLVTSAMNAYGVANLSAAQATDILVATVREGKAQADALAGSMGMVLPIASYMGVTFDQVGGAIAAMTRTGTSAGTASIQLRQILNSLVKPTQQAEEAMSAMGTSSAELRKTIREDGLLAALMKVRELTQKFGETTMSKVFPNIRALSGVLDIMGKNLGDNVKIFESVSDAVGSMDFAFAEASQTLEFKWNQAISTGKVALTELGKSMKVSVVPIMEKLTKRLQNLTDWFNNLQEGQRQAIIRFGALLAVVGPVSLVLGFLATNVFPGLIKMGYRAVQMFKALRVAMLANPLLMVVAALAAVATGLLILARRAKNAREEQERFNNIVKEATRTSIEQRKGVEQLIGIAQDETKSTKERESALSALNRVSKEYFGNLNLENINTEAAIKSKKRYIDELIREAKVRGAMDELVRLEKERYKKINEMDAARLKFGQKTGVILRGVFRGQTKAMMWGIDQAKGNIKEAEAVLDGLQEKTKAFLDEIVTAEDISSYFGIDDGGGITEELRGVTGAMNALADETKYAETMSTLFGKSFDANAHLINAAEAALDTLVRLGLDPTAASIKEVLNALALLKQEAAALTMEEMIKGFAETEKAMDKAFDAENLAMTTGVLMDLQKQMIGVDQGIRDSIMEWHGLAETTAVKFDFMAGFIKNAFQGMSNVISNSLNSTENVLKAFGKFFANFAKGLVFKLVAATIAAATLAVVLSLIPGIGAGNIFTGLTKAAKFGDIFKAGLKSFTGLQHGGIIPPGYPNDTFPALLSSGEKVIPATQPISQMSGEVIFKIGDDELIGILKRKVSIEENY